MRKLILALGTVLVLASFTNNPKKTIVLKDIDGTLLKSYVTINEVNGEYIATFSVDANTVVTTKTMNNETHVYLVENGNAGVNVTHSLRFDANTIDFSHYFDSGAIASFNDLSTSHKVSKRPREMVL